ncbi:nitrate reductase molybdenum cofactor assembly chaperone [Anaplasmataceae bacterium AB001_6]|nr:nitrate reductase molybdenum cofactor assembly chaperone [Anaplasmataceae bacterium AB001_6]
MKTFKLLGLLLVYPKETIYLESNELLRILRSEQLLSETYIKKIEAFLNIQKTQDLISVQENYVETFDHSRSRSLHLFEHIHGESRDRGQAMVNLSEAYAEKDLYISSGEIPDYLPLFMEYLSCCEFSEASELLSEIVDIIAMIKINLEKRKSPYANIFASIEALSSVKANDARVKEAIKKAPKDPVGLEEIDEQWEEKAAFTGDPIADLATNCNNCSAFTSKTLNEIDTEVIK